MKSILLGLAVLFGLVGYTIWSISGFDPAPRAEWVKTTGIVSKASTFQTQKSGRVWRVELAGDPDKFSISRLDTMPELEPRLLTEVSTGSKITIQTVPRRQARAIGASNLPIPILVLQLNDEVLYDRDEQTGDVAQIFFYAGRGTAIFAWLVSLLMLIIFVKTFRSGK